MEQKKRKGVPVFNDIRVGFLQEGTVFLLPEEGHIISLRQKL